VQCGEREGSRKACEQRTQHHGIRKEPKIHAQNL
jgi:hypothetical protein